MVIPLKDLVVQHKTWITAAGFPAVIRFNDHIGVYCGYVGVPHNHPLFGVAYDKSNKYVKAPDDGEKVGKRGTLPLFIAALSDDEDRMRALDVVFDVHGGLTYSGLGRSKKGQPSFPDNDERPGYWWFGFDCGHAGDGRHEGWLRKQREKHPSIANVWRNFEGDEFRGLCYVEAECERLAIQLVDRVRSRWPHEWVAYYAKRFWHWVTRLV